MSGSDHVKARSIGKNVGLDARQSSRDAAVLVTRNRSQQRIAEYTDEGMVNRPFFKHPDGRMALNKSLNAIQMIEKGASKGRILKQTSLKSALLARPITSSTKPSH